MSDNRKPPYDDDSTRIFNLNEIDDEMGKTKPFKIDDRGLNDDEKDFFSDDAVEDLNDFATKKINLGDKSSYNDNFNMDLPTDKEGVSVYNDNFDNFSEESSDRMDSANRDKKPVNHKRPPEKKSKKPVVIGIVCVALVIAIVVIILLVNGCSDNKTPVDTTTTSSTDSSTITSTTSLYEETTYEEDTTYQDPQNAGQPAEHSSGDGAGNGTGAGDGGEMMAHQNRGLCGDVVNAVLQGVCGGGIGVFTYAPLLAQVAAIEDITADQNGNADQQKYETVHRLVCSLLFLFPGTKILFQVFPCFPSCWVRQEAVCGHFHSRHMVFHPAVEHHAVVFPVAGTRQ